MDSIILAGGYATRLYPLTKDNAKPLLKIGERPILYYILDALSKFYNNTDGTCYLTINKRF